MRDKDRVLSTQCRSAAKAASDFIDWSAEHRDIVGQNFQAIRRDFNKFNTQLKRLSVAAERPMAVAVFGPSQAGKSYLISALARDGEKALQAKIGIDSVDFLKQINPEGGKESTGIVTRFTIRESNLPFPNMPVKTRLLDQVDLVKIIGNTFLSDVDPACIPILEAEDIEEILKEGESKVQQTQIDNLTSNDVFDLRDYFMRYFRGVARIRMLTDEFWETAAELLPRLEIADRARFLSVFWGGTESFSNLYIRLYEALKRLDFSVEAYSALGSPNSDGALMPRSKSIIDVSTLRGLGRDSDDTLKVVVSSGTTSDLQRSEFAALISELVIQIEDIPYDYFRYTDLLDFPGYRSREQIRDLDHFLQQENSIESLFLRGKVAYLFQRYREERELTSMLLCVADNNQEVKSLPDVIDEWIRDTHGDTSQERSGKVISLFLVLTKFDKEFDRKGGGGDTPVEYAAKWKTRLHSSLWDFFGKQHSWPLEWSNTEVFNNSYWIRNPKYEAPHLYQYDNFGREVGLLSTAREVERINGLKQAFLTTPEVAAHFRNPLKAWDSALLPNDGGISYLANELGKVCDPDLKHNQLVNRYNVLKRDMLSRVQEFYIGDDSTKLVNKRIESSRDVVKALTKTAKAERFGSLISQLYVAESTLRDLYLRLDKERSDDVILVSESKSEDNDFLEALGLETELPDEKIPEESEKSMQSLQELYAAEVASLWVSKLHDFVDDSAARNYYFISEPIAQDFIRELKAGFSKTLIQQKITNTVTDLTRLRLNIHKAIAYPTRLSANLVNDYVNYLGFNEVSTAERPEIKGRPIFKPKSLDCGPPSLSETPSNYHDRFVMDWLKGFLSLAEHNARFEGGMSIDPVANEKLSMLISTLEG